MYYESFMRNVISNSSSTDEQATETDENSSSSDISASCCVSLLTCFNPKMFNSKYHPKER